jgi:GH15 family glucan-1,4-alpha-glucosidase
MPSRIEDYAILGDCQSIALVGKDGSIDWLCLPYFDSGACFAALLGGPENGRWQICPQAEVRSVSRQYRDDTLVLETEFATDEGTVTLIDLMPVHTSAPELVRVVVGRSGVVRMRMELVIRFDYGSIVPWVESRDGGLNAIAGPDLIRLITPVPTRGENLKTIAEFEVRAGERVPFVLTWSPSHLPAPEPVVADEAIEATARHWHAWAAKGRFHGPHAELVRRSLITLKALTFAPTGGIVAAPTTSLPEQLKGVRNWDYRFCWLRDAALTLNALMAADYSEEAAQWRDWLQRAAAGDPTQLQILYGLRGERRSPETELPWLPGYEGAKPVRIGNAASQQFQLDVYGEVMWAMFLAQHVGLVPQESSWRLQCALMSFVMKSWKEPDEGIWEIRGPRRHFTHSKVMAWLALDCAVKSVEQHGLTGPVDDWRTARAAIHESVCLNGFDHERNAFVQYYGAKELDASLLMIPIVGFLPPTDPRMLGTVAAIEKELMHNGLVKRYATESAVDGLPPGEGVFLPCSFWLVDNYVLQGREREALAMFERLVGLCNDVGLLSEEYDPLAKRMLGNFPQALSHISLVNSALRLAGRADALNTSRAVRKAQ